MMQRMTPAVLNLIILNVLVYMCQKLVTPVDITGWGSLHYFRTPAFMPHQLITHMFLHDPTSLGHLFFNMLGLWMFGTILEHHLGPKRFLLFYLLCGFGAGVLTELTIPLSADVFINSKQGVSMIMQGVDAKELREFLISNYSMLGASGAVMGVTVGLAYLFPNMPLIGYPFPFPIKAIYLTCLYIAGDLFGSFNRVPGDNVSHFTHLGGALVGFLIIYFWNKTNRKTFY